MADPTFVLWNAGSGGIASAWLEALAGASLSDGKAVTWGTGEAVTDVAV